MKRRVLRAILAAGLLIVAIIMLAVAVVVFSPETIWRQAAGRVHDATGIDLVIGSTGGNLLTGLEFRDLRAGGRGWKVTADRLRVALRWSALFRKKVSLRHLEADGLEVQLDIKDLPKKKRKPPPQSKPAWDILVSRARIRKGLFELKGLRQPLPAFAGIDFNGSFQNRQVNVDELAWAWDASRWKARGVVPLSPLSVQASIASTGTVTPALFLSTSAAKAGWAQEPIGQPSFDVQWSPAELHIKKFSLYARDTAWSGAVKWNPPVKSVAIDVRGQGAADFLVKAQLKDKSWRMRGTLSRLDLRSLWASAPASRRFWRGRWDANGEGFGPAEMTLAGHIALRSDAATIMAEVKGERGLMMASATASDVGLTLATNGRIDAAKQSILEARAQLSASPEAVRLWSRKAEGVIVATATARGSFRDPQWEARASVERATVAALGWSRLEAHGRSGPEKTLIANLHVEKLVKGQRGLLDEADLAIRGTTQQHDFDVRVATGPWTLQGQGRGGTVPGGWAATWNRFQLDGMGTWTAAEPFATRFAGGAVIEGLELVQDSASIRADVHLQNGTWRDTRLLVDGFPLVRINDLHLFPQTLDGALTGGASLRGPVAAPTGTASFYISSGSVNGQSIGSLSGRAALTPQVFEADPVLIELEEGSLEMALSRPRQVKAGATVPLSIRLVAKDFDPAGYAKLAGMEAENARLNANLTALIQGGQFSSNGFMTLTAHRFKAPAVGAELREVDFGIEALGTELRIKKAQARSGKEGRLSLAGSLDTHAPNVKLEARKAEFNHPAGARGRFNADLAFAGRWDAPSIVGQIKLLSADIEPDKAKKKGKSAKKKKPERKQKGHSTLAMDVRIRFDSDVWYRKGQSAIEFKGDVNARKESRGPLLLFGTIETVRGNYFVYGRHFKIERGRIVFAGEEELTPYVDLVAVFEAEQSGAVITAAFKGRIGETHLELTSNPPMDQTDIVSVLVTGRPLSDAGNGTGDTDRGEAARMLALNYAAGRARQWVQGYFRLDELRFRAGDEGNTTVVVGQNVTEDLYVSLDQTLGVGGERRINAEYDLGTFIGIDWGLQGYTTSLGKYVIDLLFLFGFR